MSANGEQKHLVEAANDDQLPHAQQPKSHTQSRRNFLVRSSMLLAAVGAGATLEPAKAQTPPADQATTRQPSASENKQYHADSFGRMFPQLPPFAEDTPQVRAALFAL
ncbi:MAG: twin-arginine translocation signal domain-containing protein, partial [Chloroflexi bacterium]|nr:twin-arginine translocation signal domain-containing protein [Chloroflexota bacterium]